MPDKTPIIVHHFKLCSNFKFNDGFVLPKDTMVLQYDTQDEDEYIRLCTINQPVKRIFWAKFGVNKDGTPNLANEVKYLGPFDDNLSDEEIEQLEKEKELITKFKLHE